MFLLKYHSTLVLSLIGLLLHPAAVTASYVVFACAPARRRQRGDDRSERTDRCGGIYQQGCLPVMPFEATN